MRVAVINDTGGKTKYATCEQKESVAKAYADDTDFGFEHVYRERLAARNSTSL